MLVLKRYLMVFLILNCGHAVADLPDDADRTIDVQLAGFLYSQGIYKQRSGAFSTLSSQVAETDVNRENEDVEIPDNASAYDTISTWLKSTEHSISIKDIVTP